MSKQIKFHESKYNLSDNQYTNTISNLQVTTSYFNYSTTNITFIGKENIPLTLFGDGQYDRNQLIIKRQYSLSGARNIENVITNIVRFNHRRNIEPKNISDVIHLAIIDAKNRNKHGHAISFSIDEIIDVSELRQHEYLYLSLSDIVVYAGEYDTEVLHPFSEEGYSVGAYHDILAKMKVSGMFLEIIDNTNTVTNRYIYSGKQVIKVPVRKDISRKDGVYYNACSYTSLDEVIDKFTFLTFDEAKDKIGLYKTMEDALTNGDPSILSKKQLSKAEKELYDKKLEAKTAEIEAAKLAKILAAEQLELKNKHEKERLERIDEYEKKSHERKDASEMIKFIPAVLLGAAGIYAVITRLMKD